jgi:ankyrin repeat protein
MPPVRRNPFLRAVALGDLAGVSRMIDQGQPIDQVDQEGSSGVHIALVNRNLPMLKLLARRGASLTQVAEKPNGLVYYPVETAIISGFVEGLRFLVDDMRVPLISAQMDNIDLMLFHAMDDRNNILTIRYLVEEKKLDPRRAVFSDRYNLLHKAEVSHVHPAIVEYFLRKGVSPDINCITVPRWNPKDPRKPYDGMPLTMAAFTGEPERIIPYLNHDAEPSDKNHKGKNAFDAAAENYAPTYDTTLRDFDETTRLLKLAANGEDMPKYAQNKFILACAMGNLKEVERLLEDGEDPDQMDSQGMTGIHTAIVSHDVELLELLLDYDADPRKHIGNDENNLSPVELAIQQGFLTGLQVLAEDEKVELEARPDQNVHDLLFHALYRNDNILTLRYLVEKQGLDPARAGFHEGMDILEESEISNSFLTYTEYLMMRGMDPNHETPERDRDIKEIDLYDTAGAVEESFNGLPLVRAAFNLEAALVDLYLDYKASPLQWNRHNNSAWDAVTGDANPNLEDDPAEGDLVREKLLQGLKRQADSATPPAPPRPS